MKYIISILLSTILLSTTTAITIHQLSHAVTLPPLETTEYHKLNATCEKCFNTSHTVLGVIKTVLKAPGDIVTCNELCIQVEKLAKNSTLVRVTCETICTVIGIQKLPIMLNKYRINLIRICAVMKMCELGSDGSVSLDHFSVLPVKGKSGSKFDFKSRIHIKSKLGITEFYYIIKTKTKFPYYEPVSYSSFTQNMDPGHFKANDNHNVTLAPGNYTVEAYLCYEMCFAYPPGKEYSSNSAPLEILAHTKKPKVVNNK